MRLFYSLFFFLLLASFANAGGEEPIQNMPRHLLPKDMGQDFIDNPPICYPQSSQNWEDEYEATFNNLYFGATASCKDMSKKLKRRYSVMGGGVVHIANPKQVPKRQIWHLNQSQPTVAEPGVHETEGWKCVVSNPNQETPLNQLWCMVSCCQLTPGLYYVSVVRDFWTDCSLG